MSKCIRIKEGFDIRLVGSAEPIITSVDQADTFAIKPPDFHGIYLAKAAVQEGDNVKAGTPLFFDKREERIVHASPVSGEVVEVRRGAKRKLLEIKILADREVDYILYERYSISDVTKLKADAIKKAMLKTGVWPNIIQRPFGVIANPDITPKSIHISTFDTHPLAPDYSVLFKNQERFFQIGVSLLKKLTPGPIHLNMHVDREISSFFSGVEDAVKNKFLGPHPSGCVGVQIHHIDPINKGDVVWTISPFGVIQIGKLFHQGIHDASRIIAVVGSEVKKPRYYKTYTGASVSKFLQNNLKQDHVRVVSGNVLTGTNIGKNGHVGYFDHAITVIPEKDKKEHSFLGWARPSLQKLSFHRTIGLFSFLNRRKKFILSTHMHGEPRTFVQAGAFEQVTPMDILPTYLLKSIIAKDIDEMEELGIYEVIEEDLALCEFIDVSKHNIQALLREGMDLVQTS